MSPLILRPLRTDELLRYQQIGRRFFPQADWTYGIDRVSKLLACWPDGIHAVWQGDEIAGYLALWPLSDQAARRIESGQLTDNDIDARCLPNKLQGRLANWIMTAVAVVPSDKATRGAIIKLLLGILTSVRSRHAPTQVYAHAVTPEGRRFCARTGFRFLYPHIPNLCVLTDPPDEKTAPS